MSAASWASAPRTASSMPSWLAARASLTVIANDTARPGVGIGKLISAAAWPG